VPEDVASVSAVRQFENWLHGGSESPSRSLPRWKTRTRRYRGGCLKPSERGLVRVLCAGPREGHSYLYEVSLPTDVTKANKYPSVNR
jgi:hypothetical protein